MQTDQATPSTPTAPAAPPTTVTLRPPPTETELCAAACIASHPHCFMGNRALDMFNESLVALASLAPDGSGFARRITGLNELLDEIGSAFQSLSIILHERRVDLLITAPAAPAAPPPTGEGVDVFDLLGHFLSAAIESRAEPPQFTEEERRRVLSFCMAAGVNPAKLITESLLAKYAGGKVVGL